MASTCSSPLGADAAERVSPDGSPDPTFGTQGAYVQAFSIRRDGSIVVAVRASGPPRSLLLRLTAAGGLDPRFAGGSPATLTPYVGNVLVGADGGIVLLTYEASTVYDSKLVRIPLTRAGRRLLRRKRPARRCYRPRRQPPCGADLSGALELRTRRITPSPSPIAVLVLRRAGHGRSSRRAEGRLPNRGGQHAHASGRGRVVEPGQGGTALGRGVPSTTFFLSCSSEPWGVLSVGRPAAIWFRSWRERFAGCA